nr:hypothetical protein [uncultured bacterium]
MDDKRAISGKIAILSFLACGAIIVIVMLLQEVMRQ